jgi:fused signal recognition particle receptor
MSEAAGRKWWRPWQTATGGPPAAASPPEFSPTELLSPDAPPAAAPVAEAQLPDEQSSALQASAAPSREGWFARLRAGLSRSSNRLKENISGILTKRRLDAEALEELEEALITADLGVEAAAELTADLGRTRFGKEVTDEEVRRALAESVAGILEPVAQPLQLDPAHRPHVILMCGVNGTGKTTTIGKLARQFRGGGEKVVLAAGDTFRAAAIEQLEIWGERAGCPVIKRPPGSDAAGLAFDALRQAQAEGADVLLIDTAGRLHNKAALMDELAKVVRVLRKLDPDAPHDTLLVLDATTGQNARSQVETFLSMVPITGLVVTKLDGTARGGVVVALAKQFGLPIVALGVGESLHDLRPFQARAFAEALLGLEAA